MVATRRAAGSRSRLVYLCEYPQLQGGERSLLATVTAAQEAGFAPLALAPPNGPLAAEFRRRNVEVLAWETSLATEGPCTAPTCRPAGVSRDARRVDLATRLEYCGAQLLHANSLSMGRLSGPVARSLELPSLAHLRDIIGLSRRAVDDLNQHRRLLAVSEATRAFHSAQGVSADRIEVLYNGVDLAEFCPRAPTGYLHRELGLAPEAILIGVIGQICLRKGHDILLRVALELVEAFPTLHFLVVGARRSTKDESIRFEHRLIEAADGRLAGRLHLLGERGDVALIMNELSLLVHPARQEPLGRVLLEAGASGTPVVATEVGGTREIFPREANAAVVVPPGEPAAFARAVTQLVEEPQRRELLGRAARLRVESAFGIETAGRRLVDHYRALIESI